MQTSKVCCISMPLFQMSMNVLSTMVAVTRPVQITRVPLNALAIGDIHWRQMGNLARVRKMHPVKPFIPAPVDSLCTFTQLIGSQDEMLDMYIYDPRSCLCKLLSAVYDPLGIISHAIMYTARSACSISASIQCKHCTW